MAGGGSGVANHDVATGLWTLRSNGSPRRLSWQAVRSGVSAEGPIYGSGGRRVVRFWRRGEQPWQAPGRAAMAGAGAARATHRLLSISPFRCAYSAASWSNFEPIDLYICQAAMRVRPFEACDGASVHLNRRMFAVMRGRGRGLGAFQGPAPGVTGPLPCALAGVPVSRCTVPPWQARVRGQVGEEGYQHRTLRSGQTASRGTSELSLHRGQGLHPFRWISLHLCLLQQQPVACMAAAISAQTRPVPHKPPSDQPSHACAISSSRLRLRWG